MTTWNRGAERIFGYSAEEIVGKPISVLTAPGRGDDITKVLEQIKRGERVEHYETQRRRKDGAIVDISLTISPMHDAEGRIIGASKIARDITAQKAADNALQLSETKYRTTFEMAPVGAIHVSPDRRYLMVNEFYCNLLGYTRDELLGKDVIEVTHPDDAAETLRNFQKVYPRNLSHGQIIKRYRRKSGETVWCEATYADVRDAAGKVEYSVAIISDISERKAAEERQAHLAAQLQQAQKMETIGQLTGGIAHDFNNFLSIVLGNLEFLEETCPPDSQQATFIGNAIKAALRGAELIRRLLAFARRQSLAPRLTELAPVLEGSGQLFRRTLE